MGGRAHPVFETIASMMWHLKKQADKGRDDDQFLESILYWTGKREMLRQLNGWRKERLLRDEEVNALEELMQPKEISNSETFCTRCALNETKKLTAAKKVEKPRRKVSSKGCQAEIMEKTAMKRGEKKPRGKGPTAALPPRKPLASRPRDPPAPPVAEKGWMPPALSWD